MIKRSGIFFFLLFLLYSCAQQVSPTGGIIDRVPPKLKSVSPKDSTTNFTGNKIEFQFNEFIQIKDINNQLIISPSMEKFPEITTKGRKLTIKLKEDLKPNTTYQFNFGSAIADITESNIAEDLTYVISTGNELDSLFIEGIVEFAEEIKTEKGIMVGLYEDMGDSAVYKKQPTYVTKTKENGSFKIKNIKAGTYKLYAIKDINRNSIFDEGSEQVAFFNKTINLPSDSSTSLKIKLFTNQSNKQFIKKSTAMQPGKIQVIFNTILKRPEIASLDSVKQKILITSNIPSDTLEFYYDNVNADAGIFVLSDRGEIIDTLELTLPTKINKVKGGRGKGVFKLNATDNLNGSKKFDINKTLYYNFNNPITKIDTSFVSFYNNTKKEKVKFAIDSINSLKIKIIAQFEENSDYTVQALPGSFKDIYELTNDTLITNFKTTSKEIYGTLKLTVKLSEIYKENYIALLFDEKNSLIDKRVLNVADGIAVLKYEYLNPGNYSIKLIEDNNKNYKWDTGNILNKTQPERYIYYDGKINVRENWDLEQEWLLN